MTRLKLCFKIESKDTNNFKNKKNNGNDHQTHAKLVK